ncbi:MAG: DNA repair protein RadC [Clostridia bacterium]|nr:DNA repair protein RadC [Clostridia bacterium]
MIRLKNLPISERPYEKCILYGEKSLSIVELIAIIIHTGMKEKSAIDIAMELINKNTEQYNNIRFLQDMSIKEFMKIKGIGLKKAVRLKAVGELSKRMSVPLEINKVQIKSSVDVSNILMEEMRYEKQEVIKVILLNSNNRLMKIVDIASGNSNKVVFDIKQILSEPIKLEVPKIILVHNHPSGNPKPSSEDILITRKIKEAAGILGIDLIDHIIIGDGEYKSII